MKLDIEIKAVPFSRPRFGRNKQVFDSPRYSAFKTSLRFAALKEIGGKQNIYTGAIKIAVTIYKTSDKITSRNWGDADNHLKAVLDSLQGIAFIDDAQIVDAEVHKRVDTKNHISIEIEEAG